jgi:seryl-tRNA synthetase
MMPCRHPKPLGKVPYGKDEHDNQNFTPGQLPTFKFEPRQHFDIGDGPA